MSKEDLKIVALTTKEILMNLVDFAVFNHEIFDVRKIYRKEYRSYWKWRDLDKTRFSRDLYKLKNQKLIKIYLHSKEKYIELTPKGIEKLRKYCIDDLAIKYPKKWDYKWRIVIFDIPNDKKSARDMLRSQLKRIGFIQLQESVLIYPFDCKAEIDYISETYYIKHYVKYIVADFFEDDHQLIKHFLDNQILLPKMIKKLPQNTLERKMR